MLFAHRFLLFLLFLVENTLAVSIGFHKVKNCQVLKLASFSVGESQF